MTDEDLKNSITLIGPSSVGKSLIASELSKKLNIPYVCIDDLLVMIDYEQRGLLSIDKKVQKRFVKLLIEDIKQDEELSVYMHNPTFRTKEIKLINDFIELYNYYAEMFGGLHHFYGIAQGHEARQDLFNLPILNVENLKVVTAQIIATIMDIYDKPLVFDVPASFGWETSDLYKKSSINIAFKLKTKNIDLKLIQKFVNSFLNETTTVFLSPGIDYNERNSARFSRENNMLLESLSNYYNQADIEISTNALFNEPSNKFLQKRSWLNPEEAMVKEKLKNKGEINNICDEIILSIEELKNMNSLN
ncbi:MAG: hypothetical protein IJW36_03050 [Clostridia bacterium]|nr:hypothetical protein [Clostridia bacterium]